VGRRLRAAFDSGESRGGLDLLHTTGLRPSALRRRSVLLLGWLVFQGISIEVRILQLSGRRIVDHDRDVRMELEDRSGAACGKRTLDGRGDRLRLVTARCDEHEMPGSADGSESLGDDVAGHVVDAGEEPCVVVSCLLDKGLDPGA
jgi:hypothetical protein